MAITTTSILPAPVQQSFSYKLLSVPTPDFIHRLPAEKKLMPRNGGTTLRFRRYNALNTALVPLGNSGVTPPSQQLTAVDIDVRISFYGTWVSLNEQVTLQNQDPVLNEASRRLGVSLKETEDVLTRNMLASTASVINATGGVNGDTPTELTRNDVDNIVRTLKGNNTKPFLAGQAGEDKFGSAPVRWAYFALGHTSLIGDLENVNGFISQIQYPNPMDSISDAEWGSISNLRFLLSSIGSITASSSSSGNDVFNVFCVGREAYACVEQDGYSAQFIYRPPIYDGPLAQNSSAGYKFAQVPRILNDLWVQNLRCTLS